MKKLGKKDRKLLSQIQIIDIIIIIGFIIALVITKIKIEQEPRFFGDIYKNLIPFTDFTDVLKYSIGEGTSCNYFPFAYLIMAFFEKISFNYYRIFYFLLYALFLVGCFCFCKYFLKEKSNWYILIFIIMQFPILFNFQRGNIEFISLSFCMLFYILYKKEKYNLSAIILSFAICLKLYPALLAILFINKKQYKSFILCILSCIGVTRYKLFIKL